MSTGIDLTPLCLQFCLVQSLLLVVVRSCLSLLVSLCIPFLCLPLDSLNLASVVLEWVAVPVRSAHGCNGASETVALRTCESVSMVLVDAMSPDRGWANEM